MTHWCLCKETYATLCIYQPALKKKKKKKKSFSKHLAPQLTLKADQASSTLEATEELSSAPKAIIKQWVTSLQPGCTEAFRCLIERERSHAAVPQITAQNKH